MLSILGTFSLLLQQWPMNLFLFRTWLLIIQSFLFFAFAPTLISLLCCSRKALRNFQQLRKFAYPVSRIRGYRINPELQLFLLLRTPRHSCTSPSIIHFNTQLHFKILYLTNCGSSDLPTINHRLYVPVSSGISTYFPIG